MCPGPSERQWRAYPERSEGIDDGGLRMEQTWCKTASNPPMLNLQSSILDSRGAGLQARVVDVPAGPARLLMCTAPVRDVVSFRGSFRTGPDLSSNDDMAQQLAVDLLDKGTRVRDRFAVAAELEGRGAQLHLYADNLRVGFAGRSLQDDVRVVLELLLEQLLQPAFPEDEFDKERRQAIAAVRRSMDSTAGQATGALTRRLYAPAHPNYVPEPAAELERLSGISLDEVANYHATHFGPDSLMLAF